MREVLFIQIDPIEAEECLKRMVYVVDCREQATDALKKRLEYLTPNVRETVNAGDYTAKTLLPDGTWFYLPVAVERKMSLTEIAGNFTRDRDRFRAEFNRARDAEIRLYILIEQASWDNTYGGIYRSKIKPQSLVASLLTWSARYHATILMCDKPSTGGKLIRDILHYEMREALEKMVMYG